MNYLRVENFLSPKLNQLLFDWCVNNRQAFETSTVTSAEAAYRKSLVAFSCPLASLVTTQIQNLVPIVSSALSVGITEISSLECQVTAHGNGDYFKIHTDNNDPHCSRRILSYVYYFHTEPKIFQGGELALYSDREKRDRVLITPDNNSLVCFPSNIWHEVLAVVGSLAFDHGRFTVNGWINQ